MDFKSEPTLNSAKFREISQTFSFENLARYGTESSGANSEVVIGTAGVELNAGDTGTGLAGIAASGAVLIEAYDSIRFQAALSNDLGSVADSGSVFCVIGSIDNEYVGFRLAYGSSTVTLHIIAGSVGNDTESVMIGTVTGTHDLEVELTQDKARYYRNGALIGTITTAIPNAYLASFNIKNVKTAGTANNVAIVCSSVSIASSYGNRPISDGEGAGGGGF